VSYASPPVVAGLAAGIAFIVVLSIFSLPNQRSKEISVVLIPQGASLESNPPFLIPKVITVKIGVNNTVRWVSQDTVPHAVTSDTGYADPLTDDAFDSKQRPAKHGGAFLIQGDTFEFTFTEPGEFGYHGEPHPWMQGTVIVLPP
jgi:plastocyanin